MEQVKKRGRKTKQEAGVNKEVPEPKMTKETKQIKVKSIKESKEIPLKEKKESDIDARSKKIDVSNEEIEETEENDKDHETNVSISITEINIVVDKEAQYHPNIPEIEFIVKDEVIAKKRGRKPKGGKIIQQSINMNNLKETKPNIILHLKCSSKDLINNVPQNDNLDIESYNFTKSKNDNICYEIIGNTNTDMEPSMNDTSSSKPDSDNSTNSSKHKVIWSKLKTLEQNLHLNNISDKRSACFWCTYDFENPPIYIPKHFLKDTYHVYGCFCSPECSVAFLMDENIDSSIKFERYHFINHLYGKIFNYEKNIKPAPNPYYMLNKYYGNLTIQEYRSLLRNERLFLIVDKPLTRILPELHEDNDEFLLNNKIIPSNLYQIKKKIQKKGKNNILNEQFGITTN